MSYDNCEQVLFPFQVVPDKFRSESPRWKRLLQTRSVHFQIEPVLFSSMMSIPLYASFLIFSRNCKSVIHRSASFSEIQHRSQCSGNVIFCTLYGCVHIKSFCKVRCNGTGKCAAGSMCIRIINTFSVEPTIITITIKQVICIIQLMSALAENCAVVCITDFLCSLDHIIC